MSETTPAENEATGLTTVDFEHFGRTWTVPATLRLSHQRRLRKVGAYPNVDIVDTFLDGDQIAALDEIDPSDKELDEFTDAIVEAMGLKNAGNS